MSAQRGGEHLSGESFPGEVGWLPQPLFERLRRRFRFDYVQTAGCRWSGEVYVKPIVGRYRHHGEEELAARVDRLLALARTCGGAVECDPQVPLWRAVEWLENSLEFELRPPCGCAPCSAKPGVQH